MIKIKFANQQQTIYLAFVSSGAYTSMMTAFEAQTPGRADLNYHSTSIYYRLLF